MRESKRASGRCEWLEELESRSMLSASLPTPMPPLAPNTVPAITASPAATVSLIGVFKGTATSRVTHTSTGIIVNVQAVSSRGVYRGAIGIQTGRTKHTNVSFSGTLRRGVFTITLTNVASGTMSGTLSTNGRTLSGSYSITLNGASDRGSFKASR